jgi:hypothetical protein
MIGSSSQGNNEARDRSAIRQMLSIRTWLIDRYLWMALRDLHRPTTRSRYTSGGLKFDFAMPLQLRFPVLVHSKLPLFPEMRVE